MCDLVGVKILDNGFATNNNIRGKNVFVDYCSCFKIQNLQFNQGINFEKTLIHKQGLQFLSRSMRF